MNILSVSHQNLCVVLSLINLFVIGECNEKILRFSYIGMGGGGTAEDIQSRENANELTA